MSDLLSRQAVIDEIRKCRFVVDAIEKIKDLPSAQPRKGKWIEDSPLVKKCSKCGYHDFDWKTKNYNFCPNCGSYNGGE